MLHFSPSSQILFANLFERKTKTLKKQWRCVHYQSAALHIKRLVLSFSIYSTATYTLYYYWWLQTFFHENGKNKYWKKDYDSNSFIRKTFKKSLTKQKSSTRTSAMRSRT